jgi:hypothetical protein
MTRGGLHKPKEGWYGLTERRRADERVRSSYLTDSRPRAVANDAPQGLVVMSAAELLVLIRDAVGEAPKEPGREPRLLDRAGLAERLACSPGHVDRMRRDGMPCLYVGDSPRFVFDDCVRWIAERK